MSMTHLGGAQWWRVASIRVPT